MPVKLSWIFAFIMLYWAYCIFWGIQGARSSRKADDYFIAGRRLPLWVFIFAATATSFSGWTFLGHPGLLYVDGLQYAYASLYAITIPFTGVLFLKRQWLLGRRFGFITPGEMFGHYFKSNLIRLLVVLVALVFSVFYLGVQLRAAGFLFSVVTDNVIGAEFGTWMLSLVLVSYVATGGLRTVAYVDSLQAILLAGGIIAIGVITLYFVGGPARLIEGIIALSQADSVRTPDGYSHYIAIPGVIQFVSGQAEAQGGAWTGTMNLTYTFGLMGIMASPAFTMWAFSSKNPAPFAPQQVWASSFFIGFILIVFTTIQGIGGHFLGADHLLMILHPELVDPVMVEGLRSLDLMMTPGRQDMLVPQLINLVGKTAPWLVGLLTVCALAAMESTASCYMATAGGILTRDLFRHFLMPQMQDHTQKFVGRISVVAVVLLALIVATTTTDALVLLGGLAVSYGFQMWPALIAVCYWPFLTRQGVIWGLVAGLAAVTVTDSIGQEWFGITAWGKWPLTIHSAGWGMLCNLSVAILVSWETQDDQDRKMEYHTLLREHTALPPSKRRWVPLAWTVTILWFLFAIGPGAIIGNTLFGDPNDPATWVLGIPSIWAWQLLGWALGVAMMWFLAYYLEMSSLPRKPVQPLIEEAADSSLESPADSSSGSSSPRLKV